ncbi:hypothetical protein JCM14469_35570 [Desulfatiferula olefinivorans]
MKKKEMLLCVNAALLLTGSLLALTGLINGLILPKGYETGSKALISFRHALVDVHFWAGLLFIILVGVHLWLHKEYVVQNWKKYIRRTP